MTLRVTGNLYRERTAQAKDAIAIFSDSGFISFDSTDLDPVPLSEVHISERVGATTRTIVFPDGAMFEAGDNDSIDAWLVRYGQRTSWRHRFERSRPLIGISFVAIALIMLALVRWGIPAVSDYIAQRLPPRVDATIASGALEALDDGVFEPTKLSEAKQHTIRERFQRLAPIHTATDFQIVFRSGGWIGANAFALPDGTVVVTDQLVALAIHADELASVLLHEIGHVVHRHSLRQVIRHSWLAMLSLLIVGDVSSAGTLVLALPSVLVQSAYSREFETESDDYALIRMQEIGLDPVHFADFMERIERCAVAGEDVLPECVQGDADDRTDTASGSGGWQKYLSTHPANAERIARFRQSH